MTSSPFGPMKVIVNPRAGRGAVERGWDAIRTVLESEDLAYDVAFTERPGHATEIAREAVLGGNRFVVAVGGDGTMHEVVNGMMDDTGPIDHGAVLGLVAAGSGSDLVRTFGLPHDPAAAARHLTGKNLWGKLDVGRVRFQTPEGERTRWFINVAEAGIGAHVVAAAAKMPKALGGAAYRLAALKGIVTYRPQEVSVSATGRKARSSGGAMAPIEVAGEATMVVIANCQFFGGGLRVAPRAIPSDAMLDLLVGQGSKWEAVRALQRMPAGDHVPHETIREFLIERVVLDAPSPVMIEADGELLGTTPATIDLVPAAIPLKI